MIRTSVYNEVNAAYANPRTTQQVALRAILDTLGDPASGGHLVRLNATDPPGCLDLLSNLTLDDAQFTQCYLRLNDLAQTFNTVTESEVHTYRWRAAIGTALFGMLELSMVMSPTGLPWVTSNVDYDPNRPDQTLQLVLPDAEAALVPGSVPVSAVDVASTSHPQGDLSHAYTQYGAARGMLAAGNVNGAFSVFLQERCMLFDLFNRYYSTLRTIRNVADPKEAPIAGCGGVIAP
jgi:hypothetical protein